MEVRHAVITRNTDITFMFPGDSYFDNLMECGVGITRNPDIFDVVGTSYLQKRMSCLIFRAQFNGLNEIDFWRFHFLLNTRVVNSYLYFCRFTHNENVSIKLHFNWYILYFP